MFCRRRKFLVSTCTLKRAGREHGAFDNRLLNKISIDVSRTNFPVLNIGFFIVYFAVECNDVSYTKYQVGLCGRVLLEKQIVSQAVQKLPTFNVIKCSLPLQQKPAIGPSKSRPHPYTPFL